MIVSNVPHLVIKTNHENFSAGYTWRPRGAETGGFMRSMTAYSGLIYCGGHGKKWVEMVGVLV
jgi:hypothetical protein